MVASGRRWGRLLLGALVVGVGCSSSEPPKSTSSNAPADPLAGAPAEWAAFLSWAQEQITATIDPVPFPEPHMVDGPKWAVLRLAEILAAGQNSDLLRISTL